MQLLPRVRLLLFWTLFNNFCYKSCEFNSLYQKVYIIFSFLSSHNPYKGPMPNPRLLKDLEENNYTSGHAFSLFCCYLPLKKSGPAFIGINFNSLHPRMLSVKLGKNNGSEVLVEKMKMKQI